MTKDSPSHPGCRASSKKAGGPGPAPAAVLEEQRRELEKLRAELREERARGRAERRRFAAQARQLREAAERERQQLADHLRSKWEAQRARELRQLQEEMLREREVEIRQLLRWKEAELRQLQQLLHRERDGVVRQARELQRQLAEELVSRGHCGRPAGPDTAAEPCRCRLQEVLAQLRWETDGEQAARIRHLQAALNVERRLFLKYILEHFRWQPPPPGSQPPPTVHASPGPAPELAGDSGGLSAGSGAKPLQGRSRSLDAVPTACAPRATHGSLPTRLASLDAWAPPRCQSLDSTLSYTPAPRSEGRASSSSSSPPTSPAASTPGSPSPPPAPPPPSALEHRDPGEQHGGDSGSQSRDILTPSPTELGRQELVRRNSELSEALQVLARRCAHLHEENMQLRRAGSPEQASEKVRRLKGKRAELTGLARRLEDRARKLQETSLRALSAPVLGEGSGGAELGQLLARQRARDLSEQASVLLARDKQIAELRQECHLLQTRVASHPDGVTPHAQWLDVNDLDRLQRESQREVLRLQRQLTLQQGGGRGSGGGGGGGGGGEKEEEALRRRQALERECQQLEAEAAAARLRGREAEAQLQAARREGALLAQEKARLQAQADVMRKAAAEHSDVREQLGRACQERDAAGLLAQQLQQEAARQQDRQQQLQHDLQKALLDLQTAQEEVQDLRRQVGHPPLESWETAPALESQDEGLGGTRFLPGNEHQALTRLSGDHLKKGDASLIESPEAPQDPASVYHMPGRDPASQPLDSTRPQAKRASSQSNSSSEVDSMWATVPSCPILDMDTASEVDDLEPDSEPSSLETRHSETSSTPKLKIFLVKYNYNPLEGPNEQPENELPLTAGDYIYIFGDMDEDGFYEGELGDGRRGLVPSNLVEEIPDFDVLGCLPDEDPDLGLCHGEDEQGEAVKEDTQHSLVAGKAQEDVDRGVCQLGRANFQTEVPMEIADAKTEAGQRASLQSVEEKGFFRPFLGDKGVLHVTPMQLHLQSVAATSAEITWTYSSNGHPHVIHLNDQEHALTPAGVNCYTFQHLDPGTQYQVWVEVQLPRGSLQAPWTMTSSTVTFTTPLAGPPDPPLDVLVEHHTSPGLLVVSWLPVTIDSAGSSNGVRVTGYAVYADGLKVAEVSDATAGSTLLEVSQLQRPLTCQKVSVRTMSLLGESLDSVPALIPQDCFTCHQLLNTSSPFSCYTCGDLSTCRITLPVCPQKLASALLSARASLCTPGSCGEPQAEFLEALPEEPPKRQPLMCSLSSEREHPSVSSGSQSPGLPEAQGVSREAPLFHKSPQNQEPSLPNSQSRGDEDHSQHVGRSQYLAPGVTHLSPECESRKEACQEKVLRQKQNAPASAPPHLVTSQQYLCDIPDIIQEKEGVCFSLWNTKLQEQRKGLRTQTLGGRRDCQLEELSLGLQPVPLSKDLNVPKNNTPLLELGADAPVRVFVALFDHDPLELSTSLKAAEEGLAFQKGQLLRVWGSQDPHGFYHGECNGQVGSIPGHLVAEVEVGTNQTEEKSQLSSQGHLPSVVCIGDFEELSSCPSPSTIPPGDPRRPPLWTPKTMVAALDYDPRDGRAGGQVQDKLSLKAGDVVIVYGPVDDMGFYYGESGGNWGLVPAYLLDHMTLQGE
ncbi:RIMS-binding protein 3A-like [Erinaceus europaeus]|uniref:RIMS-binding protein 3A-like n=1 Tax=Erinaceus europaeus TaxID=9365 RepID=A0A1S3AP99_ERIEU|nr:RIMS-binding protein 3A-like [Erinaceus europaeus]